eukprot:CAMPEP_0178982248 /NCGR_PEP_ID=MMETSP0795-20121207/393_1 /TAXON_ID=88552 /ORGANISM="Amoebophrya sp., Strain Ameob2" /LENGTH=115 /DNA_ID=CAMNT_0020672877 /DNA_START=1289 /DNA_END=1636 /DNA_ORIENTATION=-
MSPPAPCAFVPFLMRAVRALSEHLLPIWSNPDPYSLQHFCMSSGPADTPSPLLSESAPPASTGRGHCFAVASGMKSSSKRLLQLATDSCHAMTLVFMDDESVAHGYRKSFHSSGT